MRPEAQALARVQDNVGQSHVLTAMGLEPEIASSAIRVSLGPETTENDIAAFLAVWTTIAKQPALAA